MSSYRRRLLLANQSEENIIFYGNSVQEGTPAPEAPVEILSLENPIIKVDGANFLVLEGYTLRGVGEYKDCIYTNDNKVWYEQKVKSISLANDMYNAYGSGLSMVYAKNDLDMPGSYYNEGMCNLYAVEQKPSGAENIKNNHFVLGRKDKKLYVRDTTNAKNAASFNTWIKTVDSELIYPIATPIVIEMTGPLADKILAIDKSKNITITSANGVSGRVEVIEE